MLISFFKSFICVSYSFIFLSFSSLFSFLFPLSMSFISILVGFAFITFFLVNSIFSFFTIFIILFKSFIFLVISLILSKYFFNRILFSSYRLFINNEFVSFNLFKQKISVLSTLDISSSPISPIFVFNCFIFFISSSILFNLLLMSSCNSFIFALSNCLNSISFRISFFLFVNIVFISSVIDGNLLSMLFFSSLHNFIFMSFWDIFTVLLLFSFCKLFFSSFNNFILLSILFWIKFIESVFNEFIFSKGIIFFSNNSIWEFKASSCFLCSSTDLFSLLSCS